MPWTDYDGVAWYRKRVTVPREWAGKPLILQLGSVDDADRAFVNGALVGEIPISTRQAVLVQRAYRIPAGIVKPGVENVIAVRVTDGGGPGGLMGPTLSLLPASFFTAPVRLPGADRPLTARFANPPASARILKIIHGWPDEPNAQDALIRSLASQGFGGVVCNVSFSDYLRSEPRWRAFVRAVKEAKRAGMSLWLYDEKGYPSGAAGGLTLRGRPEWEARGLLIADTETEGSHVDMALPPGRVVLVAAYPVRDTVLDATRAIKLDSTNGWVRWTPPNGRWHVMAVTEDRLYEGTHAANSLGDKLPYINLLMPEPTARFLELTHGAYARRLGSDLGRYFVSTFTDEPSLMSLYLRRMPYRVLPWSPNLPIEFRKRRGYDLHDVVPLLVAGSGGRAMRARSDYWRTVGELVSESYFGQIQQWCAKHNIRSGGHLLMEEGLIGHVPLYGDFMACARRLDAPSIDCLTSVPEEVPWHIARMMGSVADLRGRTTTMCETSDFTQVYRPEGDTRPTRKVTEEEIRGTCNRLLLGGIKTITSYYTFTGLRGEQLGRLNAYVGRCSTLLTGGHQVADIAVLYPAQSVWTRFRPSRQMTSEAASAMQVENAFRTASESLYAARRDFTYIDAQAICESRVEKGALVHGAMRWRVVVLPCADTLPLACWRKLGAFVASGGALISLTVKPANSDTDFPSAEVGRIALRIFGSGAQPHVNAAGGVGVFLRPGSEALLSRLLDRLIEPDVKVAPADSPVRVTHRRVAGHDVFFLINDGQAAWRGVVGVRGLGRGETWDPLTGRRSPIRDPRRVAIGLAAYSGTLVRFPSVRVPQRLRGMLGALGPGADRPIAAGEIAHAAGQYVRATVRPVADTGGGLLVRGELTRSDVDTYLFAIHRFRSPANLGRADYLAFSLEVPGGQPGAPSLLVIVRDERGVEHYAETGVSLSLPGDAEVVVPRSRFAHAPFSAGPAGPLNWGAVTAVSIGWGGHLGKVGDRIEFTLGPLRQGGAAP